MTEYDTACISYLIIEEFTEILLVHLALLSVNNSCEAVKLNIVCINILYCTDNVAELTYAGRLDKNTVRSVVCKHLFKSFSEISDQ